MEKAEILSTFFASVFTLQVCPEASQVSESVVETGRVITDLQERRTELGTT